MINKSHVGNTCSTPKLLSLSRRGCFHCLHYEFEQNLLGGSIKKTRHLCCQLPAEIQLFNEFTFQIFYPSEILKQHGWSLKLI